MPSEEKKPYTSPDLEVVELAADEVLGGCKSGTTPQSVSSDSAPPGIPGCAANGCSIDTDS